MAREPHRLHERVLIFSGNNWNPGIIGIVAARLQEAYGKPCFVISVQDGMGHGSARSFGEFSVFDCLSACDDLLVKFCGHPGAGGFTVPADRISAFEKRVAEYAAKTHPTMPVMELRSVCALERSLLTVDAVRSLSQLEPFGAENPTPVVAVMGMKIIDIFGAGGGKHQKITMQRGEATITAMKFSTLNEDFPYVPGDVVDIAVTLDKSVYRGQESLTLVVRDMRLSETHFDEIHGGRQLFEKLMRGEPMEEQQLSQLRPTRKEVGVIYRMAAEGYRGGEDVIGCRMKRAGVGYAKLLTSLRILTEGGLLHMENDGFVLKIEPSAHNAKDGKIALENTPTAQRVGYINA